MARINIEDSIYKDFRFIQLAMKLGDIDRAIGALVRAWTLAQSRYLKHDGHIPLEEWAQQNIRDEIVTVGLATIINGHVYMSGTESQFSWLRQRSDAGKKNRDSGSERPLTADQRPISIEGRETSSSSYSSSYSYSDSSSSCVYKEKHTHETNQNLGRETKQAIEEWGHTLKHFQITKDPRRDEVPIARLIQKHGLESVTQAIIGAKYEHKSENFDPSKHVSIHRLSKPNIFDKLQNLGSKATTKDFTLEEILKNGSI